ncbi:MAG TPA: GNAT family N-acetyltransferase, partial [Blastocatellia bacterium]|nr:GNAT family N-acetyltransferase [Blastocatellia bacterium]
MAGRELVIRSATESDVQAAYGLMAELGYPDLSMASFAKTYAAVLKNPAMTLIVAEDENGGIVGLASISRRPQLRLKADLVTIDELVVPAHARGLGVGSALLEHAKEIAENSGAGRLELETNRGRESYRRQFYIKNGFTEADSAVMRIEYGSDDE